VCEGGSSFLPIWQGHPKPDHIIVVNGGVMEIHSGIDEQIQSLQHNEIAPRAHDLYKLGQSIAQSTHQREVPLVTLDKRKQAMASAMKELLILANIQK
jgi:hypothetical protein